MAGFSTQVVAAEPRPEAAWWVARGLAALEGATAGVVVVRERGFSGRRGLTPGDLVDEAAWRGAGAGAAVGVTAEVGIDAWGEPPLRPSAGMTAVGPLAVGWSGGVVNREDRVAAVLGGGGLLRDGHDDELLLGLLAASSQRTLVNRVVDAAWGLRGGFGLAVAGPEVTVALRDAHGIGRMVVGQVDGAGVAATDVAALHAIGAERVRELAPGEMVVLADGRITSLRPLSRRPEARCGLAALALASEGQPGPGGPSVVARRRAGEALARLHPAPPDAVVVPADVASIPAAVGFSATGGQPLAATGSGSAAALAAWLVGRRAVVVAAMDGAAAAQAAMACLEAGALEVHLRVTSPPVRRGCLYGVALEVGVRPDEVASAAWLGPDVLRAAWQGGWCFACADGAWPVPQEGDGQLPLFQPGA